MTIVFKAKTNKGFIMKTLAEILHSNTPDTSLKLTSSGIRIQITNEKSYAIEVFLDREKFNIYKFKGTGKNKDEPRYVGINLNHFYRMLKTVKKTDSVKLFIDDDRDPLELGIEVIPKENNRKTVNFVRVIENRKIIHFDIAETKGDPVIVSSSEFQKMCKGLSIADTTRVTMKGRRVRFTSNGDDILTSYTDLGEPDDSDDEAESDEKEEEFDAEFETEQFTKNSKISGLSTDLQIARTVDGELLLRSDVGNIGTISICLKTKEELEREAEQSMFENHYDF